MLFDLNIARSQLQINNFRIIFPRSEFTFILNRFYIKQNFTLVFWLFFPSWIPKIKFILSWWRMIMLTTKIGNIEICYRGCSIALKFPFPFPTCPLDCGFVSFFLVVYISCLIHKVCCTRTTLDELCLLQKFRVWKQISEINLKNLYFKRNLQIIPSLFHKLNYYEEEVFVCLIWGPSNFVPLTSLTGGLLRFGFVFGPIWKSKKNFILRRGRMIVFTM